MLRHLSLIRTFAVVAAAALLGVFNTGCASDRQILGQARQFHTALEPAVVDEVEDRVLTEYLQDVGDRIIEAAEEYSREGRGPKTHRQEDAKWMFEEGRMQFHFVNSKTLNAFTTGGEHMYIYTQLFQEADSEDELAAVMAHEFAHVYARHVHKGTNRQMALQGGALAAAAAGYAAGGEKQGQTYAGLLGTVAAVGGKLIGSKFTRDDENEADRLGFIFYTRAGWDPEKFDDFFQHMIDKGLDTGNEMMSDHPSLKNRVANTKKRVDNLPREADRWQRPPVASPAEFRRLQDRAAELAARMPNDQSLETSQELLSALPRSCLTPLDTVPGGLPDQENAQRSLVERIRAAQEAQRGQQRR